MNQTIRSPTTRTYRATASPRISSSPRISASPMMSSSPRISASPMMSSLPSHDRLKTMLYVLLALIGAVVLYLLLVSFGRHPKDVEPQASSEGRLASSRRHLKDVPPQASSQLSRAMNVATEGGNGFVLTADADGNMRHIPNISANDSGMTVSGNISGVDVTASGNISGVDVTASGNISGVDVTASGNISVVDVTASGNVKGNQICIGETCITQDHLKMLTGEHKFNIMTHKPTLYGEKDIGLKLTGFNFANNHWTIQGTPDNHDEFKMVKV